MLTGRNIDSWWGVGVGGGGGEGGHDWTQVVKTEMVEREILTVGGVGGGGVGGHD